MSDFLPTARLVLTLFRAFERELLLHLNSYGINDVTPSHFNILRHLDNDGMNISQLARDAALSKQLVGRIVQELAAKGYLQITADTQDRRVKFVRYTSRGSRLISHGIEIVADIEQRYEAQLGSDQYQQFRQQLNILASLHMQTGNNHEQQ